MRSASPWSGCSRVVCGVCPRRRHKPECGEAIRPMITITHVHLQVIGDPDLQDVSCHSRADLNDAPLDEGVVARLLRHGILCFQCPVLAPSQPHCWTRTSPLTPFSQLLLMLGRGLSAEQLPAEPPVYAPEASYQGSTP